MFLLRELLGEGCYAVESLLCVPESAVLKAVGSTFLKVAAYFLCPGVMIS